MSSPRRQGFVIDDWIVGLHLDGEITSGEMLLIAAQCFYCAMNEANKGLGPPPPMIEWLSESTNLAMSTVLRMLRRLEKEGIL